MSSGGFLLPTMLDLWGMIKDALGGGMKKDQNENGMNYSK